MRAKPLYETGRVPAALIFKPTYIGYQTDSRPAGHVLATIQSCKITKIGITI
jgi:hypothetical protein